MNPIQLEHCTLLRNHQIGGRAAALDDVTLTIEESASVALFGPNGSGKSTLLRVLAGLVRPTAGRAVVCGFDTRREATAVRRRVGYMPEHFGVYPRLTIVQYLDFFARASGVSQWERAKTVDTMLRVVDLFERRHEEAVSLSRGSRRRLALARALLHNPPVLLLDDPLGGLDGRGRLELVEVLREVRGMGITLVMSTHLLADAMQVCDSLAVLREGRVMGIMSLELALAGESAGRQRLRLEVVVDPERVAPLLARQPGVLDVTQMPGGLAFVYQGDRDGLASVLVTLVQSGVGVTHFGYGGEQLDALSAALAEGDGSGSLTQEKVPA